MPVHNAEIAALFERLADLLELEDANPFRVRAYRNAARSIAGTATEMSAALREGQDLSKLPGIGKDLAAKIRTIVETGKLPLLEEVEARTPAALSDLMKIQGLGPKRVKALYRDLDIRGAEDLGRAVRSGKVRQLDGFGVRTEALIRQRLEQALRSEQRTRLVDADAIAASLLDYLQGLETVREVIIAGSYRRRRETVGDLDILATAARGAPVTDHFVSWDEVVEIVSHGKTRATVRLRCGMQVDLRVVPGVSYGAALLYFTGSKAHNIALRTLASKKRLKLNEYGLFKGARRIAGKTESAVYAKLGLPFIEPELRENRGELEAARQGRLPALVTLQHIRGDLHCHTRATDGRDSLERMASAARDRGYDYLAITDHSRHVTVAHGLDKHRLLVELEEIERLNDRLADITLLKGIEVDILEDGRLDLPDTVLRKLDLVVGAVHYKFNLSRRRQTQRIIRAMDNPYFNILAHPSGRLINERSPYEIDPDRVMLAASKRGCFLEVNAQPARMDLVDTLCKRAKEIGLKLAISTDAHSAGNLDLMRFGISQARRGWLEADDVLNTRRLPDLRQLLRRS